MHRTVADPDSLLCSLMHNIPGAIYRCTVDDEWSMALIGDEIERISGYPAADFIGNRVRTFASVVHPEDLPRVESEIAAALAEGRAFALEYRIVCADGVVRWVLERGVRAVDADGHEWLDGVIFDVTDRRRSEEALRRQEAEAARLQEVHASRARIVEASDAARRRIERDLHDGAQQRLVAAALTLRLASRQAQDGVAELLELAARELDAGLFELRELARGIHPAVLSDRGLMPALRALAARSPVPVEVEGDLPRRPSSAVELALYFTAAEALTNVARYSEATHAWTRVFECDGRIELMVGDDGRGGADASHGSGLGGIADRLAALGGRLELHSPAGRGTTLRAVVPR